MGFTRNGSLCRLGGSYELIDHLIGRYSVLCRQNVRSMLSMVLHLSESRHSKGHDRVFEDSSRANAKVLAQRWLITVSDHGDSRHRPGWGPDHVVQQLNARCLKGIADGKAWP
jgi:hypothetical protein